MSSWPRVSIGEVAEVFDGPHATPETVGAGPVFLGIDALQNGRLLLRQTRHVTREDFKKWTRRVVPNAGDVVFSYETRLGEAALIPDGLECCLGRRMGLVRADKSRLNSRFFLYQYLSPKFQDFIRARTIHGATVDRIPLKDFPDFPILLPPLREQEGIVHILGSLDDKIELNRRMNETLEAMVQAIFRDWFVDFGPVRRKLEGATDPVKIMSGVTHDTDEAARLAALFPAALAENGLPEGWKEKGLDEIADFLNGLALQKYPAEDERDSLPVIKIAELRSGVSAKSNRAARNLPAKYVVQDGDFLFSWSGSLIAKFWTEGEGALNQHLFKVSSKVYPRWFYSQWVLHHLSDFQMTAASKATTMGHIQRHHLSAAHVACPPVADIANMSGTIGPLIDRALHNDLESKTLAAMRDLLLPKLMSGEIRLKNAERIAEAAE